ncbi:MAG: hypothetical protein IT445_05400 [Phycisphaeraceae bacterium]|nr:hypothetical protein [Phycisphaeraceae bacterium]
MEVAVYLAVCPMSMILRLFRCRLVRCLRTAAALAPSALLLTLALGGTGLLLYGCSEPQRYRVLSFFFDGVPRPGSVPGSGDSLLEQREQSLARAVAEEAKPVTWYHKPYIDRQCFDCHDREGTYQAPQSGALTCRRCHEGYFKIEPYDWVHGPVNNGNCSLCHQAHKSPHEGLLTDAQPQLCFNCHDPGFIRTDPLHATLGDDPQCSDCHDPHAAGNRLLLADARTWQRRDAIRRVDVSEHPAWDKADCARCHDVDSGNQVRQQVDQVCLECHGPLTQETRYATLHEPVAQGQCTTCHTPHRSTRPHLIKPQAEQLCYNCHDPAQLRNSTHPPVVRGDCTLCHAGHGADNPDLLKPPLLAVYPPPEVQP